MLLSFYSFLCCEVALPQAHGEFAGTLQGFYAACGKGNVTQKCKQGVGMMGKSGPAPKGLKSPIL